MTDRPRKTALVVSSTSSIDYLHLELPEYVYILRSFLYIDDMPYREALEYRYEDLLGWVQKHPKEMPKSSPADSSDIADLGVKLVEEGYTEAIILTQARSLSATYDTVMDVANMFEGKLEIEVFDTGTFGPSELPFIFLADRLIKQGKSLTHIVNQLSKMADNTDMYILPYDFSYMIKQGFVGKMQGAKDKWLKLKPVIRIRLGLVNVHEEVHKDDSASSYMARLIRETCEAEDAMCVGFYTNDTEFRKKILHHINKEYLSCDVHTSPSILAHLGPDTVGVAFYSKKSEYLPPDFSFRF